MISHIIRMCLQFFYHSKENAVVLPEFMLEQDFNSIEWFVSSVLLLL